MVIVSALPVLCSMNSCGKIATLSNQMLNSTLEEKENRVTEMILTTLNPTTLRQLADTLDAWHNDKEPRP